MANVGAWPRLRPNNQGTWLDHTDLVFVDPVGTGYSRPAKAEYGPEFYQTRGDAESVAESIRVYRNRFEAWDAPLFLTGESYGVIRAAGVAEVLRRRRIAVDGVILIGLAPPLGQLTAEMRAALMLPTYTAAAFANKKLAPELQSDLEATLRQAEEWARNEYAAALARRDNLSDAERQAVIARLARFTGLEAGRLDAKTLSIGMEQFSQQLLADRNQVMGRYDSRLVGPRDPNEKLYDPTKDPSLKNIINDVGVVRYFRNELRYKSDLLYQGPFGGGYPPPTTFRGDWMSVRWNRNPAQATSSGSRSTLMYICSALFLFFRSLFVSRISHAPAGFLETSQTQFARALNSLWKPFQRLIPTLQADHLTITAHISDWRVVCRRARFSRASKLDEAAECGDTCPLLDTPRATDRQGNRRESEDQEACLSALVAPFGHNDPA